MNLKYKIVKRFLCGLVIADRNDRNFICRSLFIIRDDGIEDVFFIVLKYSLESVTQPVPTGGIFCAETCSSVSSAKMNGNKIRIMKSYCCFSQII